MAKKKDARPKARTPRGFRDQFATDVVRRRHVLETIQSVYELYGFDLR